MKALKKIGFFLVTSALTLFIFWLLFLDKKSKNDVLEYSLNLLGDKLMRMVPDANDRAAVKNIYDKFVSQAKAEEIAPEQVEQVAANIFNLCNLDTMLTSEQAEAVMRYSLAMPLKLDRPDEKADELLATHPKRVIDLGKNAPAVKRITKEKWVELGQRIKELNKFNEEMKKAIQQYHWKKHEKELSTHYRIEPGLKVVIDPELRLKLEQSTNRHLTQEMNEMEEKQMLEWRQNFQQEMARLKSELAKIHEKQDLDHLKNLTRLKELKVLESLAALKALQGLEFIPSMVIKIDSIQAEANKSLQEANIDSMIKK